MRFVFYTHSLVSDWNHGNAHFLRGVMRELLAVGHAVTALEPRDGWSRGNLLKEQGQQALDQFGIAFPELTSLTYDAAFPHEDVLAEADVVIVHEWTDADLVARIGRARRDGGTFTLLFHDTHHRAVTATSEIASLPLDAYDTVLAFGESLRERYLDAGWGDQVVTWHEAADTRLFRPLEGAAPEYDIVWIGNWGDGERNEEITEFLVEPATEQGWSGNVYGVRYPPGALEALTSAGLQYGGWIANTRVPQVFARHRATIHIPRRPYTTALPGIPTIRVFEALACGIPLVCAPWSDCEGLFRTGRDYLMAGDGRQMARLVNDLIRDAAMAQSFAEAGMETIRARHTCAHRAKELLAVLATQGTSRVKSALAPMEAAE